MTLRYNPIPAESVRSTDAPRVDGKVILLLEDEVLIALDITTQFEALGARVFHCRTPEAALAVCDRERLDAAILDVNLGRGNDCREVADCLKATGVPFILHSGDLDRQGELIAEIDARIIPKPASTRRIMSEVSALVN